LNPWFPKWHLEVNKLIEMLECQGNKILKNVKVWWILILSPSKAVLVDYKTLVAKMAQD
jgi:hypothetical protein